MSTTLDGHDGWQATLAAAKAGQGEAAADLLEPLRERVYGYLVWSGCRRPADVAQRTFVRATRDLPSFRGDESRFRSWVFTIARREAARATRRSWTPAGRFEEQATGTERVLAAVPADQRGPVVLHYLTDLSANELAEVVGRSPEDVQGILDRADAAMKEELGEATSPAEPAPTESLFTESDES